MDNLSEIPIGLCQCGCGGLTKTNGRSNGPPNRFKRGHHNRGEYILRGENHPGWKGGKQHAGYLLILTPSHPRADSQGYVRSHILVAEKVLGKSLPEKSVVHHHDGKKQNNQSNLVICENVAYHALLHQRMRALKACGHADWRKCVYCKQYDATENMSLHYMNGSNNTYTHKKCKRTFDKLRVIKTKSREQAVPALVAYQERLELEGWGI
jgi:hypothetical protein